MQDHSAEPLAARQDLSHSTKPYCMLGQEVRAEGCKNTIHSQNNPESEDLAAQQKIFLLPGSSEEVLTFSHRLKMQRLAENVVKC